MSTEPDITAEDAEKHLQGQFREQLTAEVLRRGNGGQQSVADDLGVNVRTVRDYLKGGNVGLGKIIVGAKKLGFLLEYEGVVIGRLG